MKKLLLFGGLFVVVLGATIGVYKYCFEELVDYYVISYIPSYKKAGSNPYDLYGIYSNYSEPKINVERVWYSKYSDNDELAFKQEERKFKDRKNSIDKIADPNWLGSNINPRNELEKQILEEAKADLAQEIILEQRWLISIRYHRSKTPKDLGIELKKHVKDFLDGEYKPKGDFKIQLYELKH
ncbi:MAG: hypothetical protein IJM66_06460 [Muribaculaceae bacterium]|nr:hypothetical protein [Muribaculaceae bacterium]